MFVMPCAKIEPEKCRWRLYFKKLHLFLVLFGLNEETENLAYHLMLLN